MDGWMDGLANPKAPVGTVVGVVRLVFGRSGTLA